MKKSLEPVGQGKTFAGLGLTDDQSLGDYVCDM